MSGAIMPEPLMIPASVTVRAADHRGRHARLGKSVGGADRCGGFLPARIRATASFEQPLDAVPRLVLGQRHADHAGRGDEHLARLAAEMLRDLGHDLLDRLAPAIAGEGVRVAGVDHQRARPAEPQPARGPARPRSSGHVLREHARDRGALGELDIGQVAAVPFLVPRARHAQRHAVDRGNRGKGRASGERSRSMAAASNPPQPSRKRALAAGPLTAA